DYYCLIWHNNASVF
nr:immunoglobulin light chain junction region [Macaca mulatta]MOX69352.1 immunoglobulin light chain junction region [Macaca mulatta]MOX70070.1 immunoglobulin light chain junction region [Macaca mulatta]MOX70719.1 immunoglobulin light chain junction region [Macaca mulatta]MOX71487.1 immunoglobulin light chain junction region [Macaca mulatta]